MLFKRKIYFIVTFLLFFFACTSIQQKENETELLDIDVDSSTVTVKYKEEVFSLPSPHQASMMIKKMNYAFNKELINSDKNVSRYLTSIKKSLNLGVYATDLGYLNIYEKSNDALIYFLTIEQLADEMKISDALDESTYEQLEDNIANNDSILVILAQAYKKIEHYLIKNNQESLSVLVTAGSWVESLYIACQIYKEKQDKEVFELIIMQKNPLEKLIKILAPFYNQSSEFSELIDMFTDLAYEYDCIDVSYQHKEPETRADQKLTIINTTNSIETHNYNIDKIINKVSTIRTTIIE